MIDSASVTPDNTLQASPAFVQPDMTKANAISAIGDSVEKGMKVVGGMLGAQNDVRADALKKAAAAKKQADGLIIDNAVVEAQQAANSEDESFRRNMGEQALRESGPTLDRLDKILKDKSENFTDQNMRLEFTARARQAMLGSRKSIESHTSKQFVVGKQDTIDGLRSGVVRDAAQGLLSPEELGAEVGRVEKSFDEQMPPEAAAAAKQELRGDMAFEVVSGQIAAGNLDGAMENIKDMGHVLGAKRVEHLQERMASEKRKNEVVAERTATTGAVETAISGLRNADGFVDETAAEKKIDGMPEQYREKARALLATRLNQEADAKARKVKEWKNAARAAFNEGGYNAIPAEMVVKLQQYDPDYLGALGDKQDQKNRRELAARTGHIARVNREEAAADRHWVKVFKALPSEEREKIDVADWAVGKGMSQNGEDDLAVLSRRFSEYKDKKFSRASDEFTHLAEKMSAPTFAKKGPFKGSEDKRNDFRSEASDAFDAFVKREGRPPDAAEAQKEIGGLMIRSVLDTHWWKKDDMIFEFERRAAEKKKSGGFTTPTEAPKSGSTAEEKTVGGKKYRKIDGVWKVSK